MSGRRMIRSLTAAAGGLLGLTFLPASAAFADDYGNYDLTPDPHSADLIEIGGIRNALYEVPPAAQASAQGYQVFDVYNPTTDQQVGTVEVDVTNASDPFGNTNQELLVTADLSGTPGTSVGDVPTIGSLFDAYTYSSGYGSIYYDIPSTTPGGADTFSYDLVNPRGHLTDIHTTYDAIATVKPVETPGAGAGFTADTFQLSGPETVGGVNGIAPADYDLLGVQTFDVDDAGGGQIGTFTADIANSSDIAGNTTQDFLVTSSSGDAPAVGSVYDYFFNTSGGYNVYTAIPSSTGGPDTITDEVVNARGHVHDLHTSFDAAQGLPAELNGTSPVGLSIDLPGSYDITPDASSPGTIVAIDGIQPEDIDVQGYQLFDYTAGGQTSTFDADVAQSTIFSGTTQEQLVVTQDVSGTNAPPVGSVFNIFESANGTEKIYSDIPSTGSGPDTITYTEVGRNGGEYHLHTTYDVAAALHGDQFQNLPEAMVHGAFGADLLNVLDPSAASNVDPSAAIDAGAFADLFPHLDAALNLLTGLF
jgi:hypothetical protein